MGMHRPQQVGLFKSPDSRTPTTGTHTLVEPFGIVQEQGYVLIIHGNHAPFGALPILATGPKARTWLQRACIPTNADPIRSNLFAEVISQARESSPKDPSKLLYSYKTRYFLLQVLLCSFTNSFASKRTFFCVTEPHSWQNASHKYF